MKRLICILLALTALAYAPADSQVAALRSVAKTMKPYRYIKNLSTASELSLLKFRPPIYAAFDRRLTFDGQILGRATKLPALGGLTYAPEAYAFNFGKTRLTLLDNQYSALLKQSIVPAEYGSGLKLIQQDKLVFSRLPLLEGSGTGLESAYTLQAPAISKSMSAPAAQREAQAIEAATLREAQAIEAAALTQAETGAAPAKTVTQTENGGFVVNGEEISDIDQLLSTVENILAEGREAPFREIRFENISKNTAKVIIDNSMEGAMQKGNAGSIKIADLDAAHIVIEETAPGVVTAKIPFRPKNIPVKEASIDIEAKGGSTERLQKAIGKIIKHPKKAWNSFRFKMKLKRLGFNPEEMKEIQNYKFVRIIFFQSNTNPYVDIQEKNIA